MIAIGYKIFSYYKRNLSELIMQIISSLVGILPVYWMLVSENLAVTQMRILIFSYLMSFFISNVVIGVCFDYYRDYIMMENVDLLMSKVSKTKYIFTYSIFHLLLNVWIAFVVFTMLFKDNLISEISHLNMQNIGFLMSIIVMFITLLGLLSIMLAKVIDYTKVFSMGSLIVGILLLFSGCYTPFMVLNKWQSILFFINPFFYFTRSVQYVLFGLPLPLRTDLFFICNVFLVSILYLGTTFVSNKFNSRKENL